MFSIELSITLKSIVGRFTLRSSNEAPKLLQMLCPQVGNFNVYTTLSSSFNFIKGQVNIWLYFSVVMHATTKDPIYANSTCHYIFLLGYFGLYVTYIFLMYFLCSVKKLWNFSDVLLYENCLINCLMCSHFWHVLFLSSKYLPNNMMVFLFHYLRQQFLSTTIVQEFFLLYNIDIYFTKCHHVILTQGQHLFLCFPFPAFPRLQLAICFMLFICLPFKSTCFNNLYAVIA